MTNNKDLNYIAECAESVGIHVDEHTAISIPFIADVMQKMREQNNSNKDCISFPKGTLKKRGKGYVVYNYDWLKENWQTELKVMGIEPSVQPKQNKWIPTSERMPEDGEECIITIRERWGEDEEWDYEEPTTAYYQNGKWSPSYDVDEGQEWEVIAWMPLPTEPYKPTDSEKE